MILYLLISDASLTMMATTYLYLFSRPRVGGTQVPFVNLSIRDISVRCSKLHSYLTGVTAAQLQWHLPNMNMLPNKHFINSDKSEKITNIRNWFSNPHSKIITQLAVVKMFHFSKVASVTPPLFTLAGSPPSAASWVTLVYLRNAAQAIIHTNSTINRGFFSYH